MTRAQHAEQIKGSISQEGHGDNGEAPTLLSVSTKVNIRRRVRLYSAWFSLHLKHVNCCYLISHVVKGTIAFNSYMTYSLTYFATIDLSLCILI